MLLKQHTETTIHNASASSIWGFAYDPVNWTASNPQEHRGLVFHTTENRPATGVTFEQKEYVAGIYAVLRGQVLYAKRPNVCVWTGVAAYKLFGFTIHIPEGGTAQLTETKDGIVMSHDVFMDFPDSPFGKFASWYFKTIRKGEQAVFDHTQRELDYFKNQLENTRK